MLRTIEMYTNKYKDTTQKEIRKKKEKNREKNCKNEGNYAK